MFTALIPYAIGVHLPFEQSARLAAAHGFQGITLDLGYLEQVGAPKMKDFLSQLGLRAGSFGLPVAFRDSDDQFQQSLERLPAQAKLAAEVGCRHCSTWILSWSDELTFAENFAFHRDRLRPAAQILADHGIGLGLEFLGPKTLRDGHKYEFIHTIDGMLELADAIGTGNVGLLLDAWHWYTSKAPLSDIEKLEAKQVVDVHINDAPRGKAIDEQIDNIRCLPGETGVIDITGFLRALQSIGYDGPVGAEPFSERVSSLPAEEAVKETAAAVHKVWREAGLEA